MGIASYLSQRKKLVDRALPSFVPKTTKPAKKLYNAAMYSLMSGGKRIRPILTLAACEAAGGKIKDALAVAVAIEMIHAFTLIHDDLPAMDDDDLRRGKPACHKVFGEDTAILAGDMLNTLAFQVIAEDYGNKAPLLISVLSKAVGINGVIGGQQADISSSGKDLRFIDMHKTAALFIASVKCGAIAAGGTKIQIDQLSRYAEHLGLAFQIIDDILDNSGRAGAKMEAKKELILALRALPKDKRYDRLREIAGYLSKRKV